MRYGRIAFFVAVSVIAAAPAEAKKQPQLSPLALQQMQARDYEVSKEITFPSVMTILQDSGYRIQDADKDTGLITATASTKSKLTWAPFVGFGKSKKTPVVSAYIEDRGTGSRIRLSFVMAKVKANAYGTSLSDEEPITDPATYRDAFERVEKEIFVRQAVNSPTPAPQAVVSSAPTTPAPVAAATPAAAPTSAATQTPSAAETPATQPQVSSDPK